MANEFAVGTQGAINLPQVLDDNEDGVTGLTAAHFEYHIWDGTGRLVYSKPKDTLTPSVNLADYISVDFHELGEGAYQIRATFQTGTEGVLGRVVARETTTWPTYGMPAFDEAIYVYSAALQTTVSMLSYTSGLRVRGISSDELADADAQNIIAEALYEFARMRPVIEATTFSTVANQQTYGWSEIDANGMMVILCLWNPYQIQDGWDVSRRLTSLGVPREQGYYHMPSQDILEQIKAANWATNYGGSGSQLDPQGGDIYLKPTPEQSGDSVFLVYTKRHTSTLSIRAGDRDLFLDLCERMACERIAAEQSQSLAGLDVKTPEYQVRSTRVRTWEQKGKRAGERFISKCQAGGAACSRS